MPRVGVILFTSRYHDAFHVGQRIIRRKDNRYYIISGIKQIIEDGEYRYTIYGYLDPYQGHEQEEDD